MIFAPCRGATLGLSSGRRQDRFWIAYLGSSAQFAPQRKRYATSATKLWLEQCLDLVGKFLVRKVAWPTEPEVERSNLATPRIKFAAVQLKRLEALRTYAYIALTN
jgi:hypothetical protein